MMNFHGTGDVQELLLPLDRHFQLTASIKTAEFERQVYFAVAQAFIAHHQRIRAANLDMPDIAAIERWLSDPQTRSGGGISTPIGGLALPDRSANPSSGFDESGFREAMRQWLRQTFPSPQAGGFICVIDNLELLDTSQAARQQLEEIRDSVLNLPGLRWVLCGARGIVRSAAASPRLSGLLAEPMELGPIPDDAIGDVVDRRIEVYGHRSEPFVPVDGYGFLHIYHVLHRNLRDAFQYAERFAVWLDANDHLPSSGQDRFELLEVWLAEQAERSAEAASAVTEKGWQVFDHLRIEFEGACSPGDFASFGFSKPQAMRPHIRNLEEANLVESKLADNDKRRKTIGITPAGWLVAYKLDGYRFI